MNTSLRTNQANMIGSMIRSVILYRRRIHPLKWTAAEVTREQISRTYYDQQQRWLETKAIGQSVFRAIHAPAYAAGAAAFLICDHGHSKTAMLEFMNLLSHGDLGRNDPLTSLRRIMSTYAIQRGHPPYEPLAYMLRGWNLHSVNAKTDVISWKPEDGMPRIASCE